MNAIIRMTKYLLNQNIPTDIIEKILLETYDSIYILEIAGWIHGESPYTEQTDTLCVSIDKYKLINYVKKHGIFNDKPNVDNDDDTIVIKNHSEQEVITSLELNGIFEFDTSGSHEILRIFKIRHI